PSPAFAALTDRLRRSRPRARRCIDERLGGCGIGGESRACTGRHSPVELLDWPELVNPGPRNGPSFQLDFVSHRMLELDDVAIVVTQIGKRAARAVLEVKRNFQQGAMNVDRDFVVNPLIDE